MKAPWIALILWALSLPCAAHAQPAGVGERVRVRTTDGARLVGAFIEITPSDLGLRLDNGSFRIPLDRVLTLERSRGRRRRFGRNFLITTGVGALTMGTLFALSEGCQSACDGPHISADAGFGAKFGGGLVLGALVSAPIGLILGLAVHGERWEAAPLTLPAGASLTLTPLGAGRVALGASVPLGKRR